MAEIVNRLNQIQYQYLDGFAPSSQEERLEDARDILWRALRQASTAIVPEDLTGITLTTLLDTNVTWNTADNFTLSFSGYELTQDEDDDVMSEPSYSGGITPVGGR